MIPGFYRGIGFRVSRNYGYLFGGPYDKGYRSLEFILTPPP